MAEKETNLNVGAYNLDGGKVLVGEARDRGRGLGGHDCETRFHRVLWDVCLETDLIATFYRCTEQQCQVFDLFALRDVLLGGRGGARVARLDANNLEMRA
eukprot:SAG11_NODE_9639_length_893_cov_1.061713_1_plen_100_part_00